MKQNEEGKMDSPHPDYMHVSGKHGSERRGLFAVSSLVPGPPNISRLPSGFKKKQNKQKKTVAS